MHTIQHYVDNLNNQKIKKVLQLFVDDCAKRGHEYGVINDIIELAVENDLPVKDVKTAIDFLEIKHLIEVTQPFNVNGSPFIAYRLIEK